MSGNFRWGSTGLLSRRSHIDGRQMLWLKGIGGQWDASLFRPVIEQEAKSDISVFHRNAGIDHEKED
jgi:hypothetical protein